MTTTLPSQQTPETSALAVEEHVPLAPLTTFGIGGAARWFSSVTNEAELRVACAWAVERRLPVFVLGGGSNVLVSDAGFPGLVLRMALLGVEEEHRGGKRLFTVAAGEDWDALVTRTVEQNCAGMECLAGIPGTVGGTPVQNVGAYGQEVADTITEVRCFDRVTGEFVVFSAEACGFAYRQSRLNRPPDRDRYIVTGVQFALAPGGAPSLAYADLQRAFADRGERPSLAEVADAVRAIRRAKGMVIDPGPLADRDPDTRSAGSFFKNPIVSAALYEAVAGSVAPSKAPSYPASPAPDGSPQVKLPAAWLLEQAGFPKGYEVGGAAVSAKHTLALTNHSGHASAAEILHLQDTLAAGVFRRFGVVLEREPLFIGAPPGVATDAPEFAADPAQAPAR